MLQFTIPRKARSLYLELSTGLQTHVSCDPKVLEDQKLVAYQEASEGVAQGRVFFMLPEAFHTKRGYFELPTPVA